MYKGLKRNLVEKRVRSATSSPLVHQYHQVDETYTSFYRRRYRNAATRPTIAYHTPNTSRSVHQQDMDNARLTFPMSPLLGYAMMWRKDLHWFER
ncbi:hypothetical protein WDU94_001654 [Cyamophila willieti]